MATTGDRIPTGAGEDPLYPTNVTVRPALPTDLARMAEIEVRSFSNPWQPETFRSLLQQERAIVLVAEDTLAGVVGYTVLWWVLDQAELANVAVREDYRRRGIGSVLLEEGIAQVERRGVESLFLEVRLSNESAFRLYSDQGFTQISVRKDYYRNPREDARILVKHLSPPSEAQSPVDGSVQGEKRPGRPE